MSSFSWIIVITIIEVCKVSRVLFYLSKSAILSYDFIHGYFITECANEVVIFYFPEPGNSDSQNPQNT